MQPEKFARLRKARESLTYPPIYMVSIVLRG